MVKYFKITLIFGLVVFSTCCPSKIGKYEKARIDKVFEENIHFTQSKAIKAEVIEIPEIEGRIAVFPWNSSESLFRAKGQKTYTPTIDDIIKSETELKIKFQTTTDDFTKNFEGKTYNRRQYIGIYDKEGSKKLLINLMLIETRCQEKESKNYSFDKVFIHSNHTDNPERFIEFSL